MTRVQIARALDRLCLALCVGLVVFFVATQTGKVLGNISHAIENGELR